VAVLRLAAERTLGASSALATRGAAASGSAELTARRRANASSVDLLCRTKSRGP